MNKVSTKIIIVWRVYLTFAAFLPAFALSLRYAGSFAWWICAGLFVLVFMAVYLFYLPALAKSYAFYFKDNALVLEKGVFYQKTTVLPQHAIQSVSIGGEPLRLALKLADVTFFSAGMRVNLPGLAIDEARALAETIKPCRDKAQEP